MYEDLIVSQTSDKSRPLKQPDAILHPKIEKYIDDFINDDGDTGDLIEYLAKGYEGNLHKIDIIGSIMKNHCIDMQKKFNSFLLQRIIQLFDTTKFDQMVEYESVIPDWLPAMIDDPYWSKIIFKLGKRFPRSQFTNYCFSRLCLKHPENVSKLQPLRTKYEQFVNIFNYHFKNFSSENKEQLINLITTDSRTVMFAALVLDRNNHTSLIQEIEIKLNKTPQLLFFFQRVLMHLDQWRDDAIRAYFGQILLTPHHITLFNDYALYSNYSRSLVFRKLSHSLLDPNVDENTTNMIFTALTEIGDDSDDFQKCIKGVMVLKKWKFRTKDDLWYALNSCKQYFVATNVLTKIDSLVQSKSVILQKSIDSLTEKEPVVQILKEIFYWQPALRQRTFTRVKRLFIVAADQHQSNPRFANDLFDSLSFYFDNGYCLQVLDILKRADIQMDQARERKFFMALLPRLRAPYSEKFINDLAFTLDSKKVRMCFFPEPGKQPTPTNISALQTLVRFIEFANRQNACKGLSKQASILDDLRSSASKIINQQLRRF